MLMTIRRCHRTKRKGGWSVLRKDGNGTIVGREERLRGKDTDFVYHNLAIRLHTTAAGEAIDPPSRLSFSLFSVWACLF